MEKQGRQVDLAVYYHPQHGHDIRRFLNAMKASLDVYTEHFSPYPFRQANIVEFPAYFADAQPFAGTIAFSEGVGFIQDFDETQADRHIDLVTYVTAHELATSGGSIR